MIQSALRIACIIAFGLLIFLMCHAINDVMRQVDKVEKSLMEFRKGLPVPSYKNRKIPITDKQKDWMYFQDVVNMKYAFDCKKGVECYGRKETEIF